MEYSISKNEIIRRKIAYTRLSFSILIGTFLVSMIPQLTISIYVYFIIVLSLFLIGVYSFSFFKKLLTIKIVLTKTNVERLNNRNIEKYQISDINSVEIKYTSKNTIREIYIGFKNGKKMFVTALDRFEEFEKELLKKTKKGISKKIVHEHVDFDHPMFYILLGLSIGGVIVLLIKILSGLSIKYLFISLIACVIYMFILLIYLIKTKQISRRIGEK